MVRWFFYGRMYQGGRSRLCRPVHDGSEHPHLGHIARGRLWLTCLRLLIPATAQCLVQVHFTDQLREAVSDQRLLGTEQRALGIQERQVAVDTDAVATFCQTVVI